MSVYYKFKSAKDYDSISIEGHFITVATLKQIISEKKQIGYRNDLVVTNAQTNEEYLDEGMLIPRNTSVFIRRVPMLICKPIVTTPLTDQDNPASEDKFNDVTETKSSSLETDSSALIHPEEQEWDEFVKECYAKPDVVPIHSSNSVQDASPSKADEDNKIQALVNTPALNRQGKCQNPDSFDAGRGFGRGMNGRGLGQGGLLQRKTPPPGYTCHRCNEPGHFIQHCPTNGDPRFEVKRIRPPTGIPKSMLLVSPDGSYALPSGAVAVLKPNEAAFEKEIGEMPSTHYVRDLPPELYCPLCREVMKDAVLTGKCCFKSFCDKCIRDYIISKFMCVCGAKGLLADDLVPNVTLRATIVRISESNSISGDKGGSASQTQDTESSRSLQIKISSPEVLSSTLSAHSKGDIIPLKNEEDTTIKTEQGNVAQKILDKEMVEKGTEICEATQELKSIREPGSQINALMADDEVQHKLISGEVGKKKKKTRLPLRAAHMQWRPPQDFAAGNFLMNSYWNGIQPGFNWFGGPFGGSMPSMGYGLGDTMSFPPQRYTAESGMYFTCGGGHSIMNKEEFECQKAAIKHKQDDVKSRVSRELPRDKDFDKGMIRHGDASSVKLKIKSIRPPSDDNHPCSQHKRRSQERSTHDQEPLRASSKRRSEDNDDYYEEHPHHHQEKKGHHHGSGLKSAAKGPIMAETLDSPRLPSNSSADWKHNANVCARITVPEGDSAPSKRRKISCFAVNGSSNHSSQSHRTTTNEYHDSHCQTAAAAAAVSKHRYSYVDNYDDDKRHSKRRSSRYESSRYESSVQFERNMYVR